ncbi:bifunctional diguanylate cyclase/phosphodiesterase [Noviherbaspirillum malthae]|jgi:diguanylate cyclase (GGDEF)-like protein|uniref:bifunctional diguanylate cyclase/phosphodiesterase n=1 Tax=Noviherbaspirillum malthae TaxID=1260987 RepID=UPI00188E318C|nr:EAL domain-containing protein [Noviherbaspirillum malthae]
MSLQKAVPECSEITLLDPDQRSYPTSPLGQPALRTWRNRLDFLLANYRLALWWALGTAVLLIAGWQLMFYRLDKERALMEETALADAGILARGYAQHLQRTINTIDQLLMVIKVEWETSGGGVRLEEFKQRGVFPESAPFNASIVDRNGLSLTSTFGLGVLRTSPDVSDRPYYLAHKTAGSDFLFMSLPTWGRATGNPIIQFSRRLSDAEGNFDGVVLMTVELGFFTANYDEVTLGPFGFLGVIGTDGLVRVTRTGGVVHDPASNPIPTAPSLPAPGGSRFFEGTSLFRDGRSRFVGWQRVDGYDINALTGLDHDTVMAPYSRRRAALIHTAIALSLGVLVFAAVAAALSLRLAWRKRQLELAQATYRIATEGGSEGFYIARPVRDEGGSIVDFEAVDCNQRGAAFYGYRPEEFIGIRLSVLYAEADVGIVIGALRTAADDGMFEGELCLAGDKDPHKRYMHLKAVRSDNDLAITLRDITREKEHVLELERIGNEDVLTGLPNRLWVQSFLPEAIGKAARGGKKLAILFIDLDGFKGVNDTLGHAAGDEVLRNAALRLRDAVRPHDKVIRLGGDEFVVVIENVMQESDAAHVAERILHAFREKFRLTAGIAAVGTSIGISVFPDDAEDAGTLLQNADVAMYLAKTSGKHTYRFFDPKFYDALRNRLRREADLRHAIEHDQFVIHYQPRIDVRTGRTSSMEALVRWAHPIEGMLQPGSFIDLAEETGLVVQLGELVLNKVCAQIAYWTRSGEVMVPVSVNVSSRQFNEADISRIFREALARHGVDARLVEVELTEATMMSGDQEINSALHDMHNQGLTLLVDDFGTGYSSLAKLQQLDFDVLKVDRAFTRELGRSDQGNVFFQAIITMAHALGMRVVAEGVEEERQLDILRALGCDEVQGYLLSQPLAPTRTQTGLFRELHKIPT